ncbi:hypothetical protein CR513_06046, partial [Mucuna pruriens]
MSISKSKSRYKNVECHYCHGTGHIQKLVYCGKKESKGKKGKSKEKDHDDDNDHDHVTTTIGDDLVILRDFESVNLVSDDSMWIIDSGATLHVTPKKELFTSYTSSDFGVLKMGNNGVSKVIGVGDVCLQTNMTVQLWLRGVKHAPDVHFNFISMYMLDDGGGYDNHFGYEKWKLTKGLKNAKLEKCSHCMVDKKTRVSFKKCPPSRKSKLIELVHSDVYGPLKEALSLYFEDKGPIALTIEVSNKIWFGKDVKYDYLRVFGCNAFVHVSKDEKSKLDIKIKQCIFVGYGHDEYG